MKNFGKTLDAGKKLLSMLNKDNIKLISSVNLSAYVDSGQKDGRDCNIERRKLFSIIVTIE